MATTTCTTCTKLDNLDMDQLVEGHVTGELPTKWWHCTRCGAHMARYRGQGDTFCGCGAEYNASGQRLADNWRANPSWDDEDIDDLTGYELAQIAAESY